MSSVQRRVGCLPATAWVSMLDVENTEPCTPLSVSREHLYLSLEKERAKGRDGERDRDRGGGRDRDRDLADVRPFPSSLISLFTVERIHKTVTARF